MKNVIVRTLTGAAFIAFIIGGMYIHPLTHVFVFGVLCILGINEFSHFFPETDSKTLRRHVILGTLLYLLAALVIYQYLPTAFIWLTLVLILTEYLFLLFQDNDKQFKHWSAFTLTLFYVVMPFTLIHLLTSPYPYSPILAMGLFIIIWTNDTGAYCVGMTLGKNRLFERISPKKSWEGAIGGVVFSLAAGAVLAHYSDFSLLFWLFFALLVSIVSIFGDLFESMLKRQLDIKDSGKILPGHGGILDRLDSALFAIPAALVYVNIFFYF